jgi:hypothetical protein
MPGKPFTIGSLHFARKGEASAYLKAMLHRYDLGDKVSAAEEEVLRNALALHPDAAAKIGCGVRHFGVRSAEFGTKCFWVNRLDGTTAKFSYKACIAG